MVAPCAAQGSAGIPGALSWGGPGGDPRGGLPMGPDRAAQAIPGQYTHLRAASLSREAKEVGRAAERAVRVGLLDPSVHPPRI